MTVYDAISDGTFFLHKEYVSIADNIELIVKRCHAFVKQNNVELKFRNHIIGTKLFALVSVNKFELTIRNLIVNALKHTPPGGIIDVIVSSVSSSMSFIRRTSDNKFSLLLLPFSTRNFKTVKPATQDDAESQQSFELQALRGKPKWVKSDNICISVVDTGLGMSETDVASAFNYDIDQLQLNGQRSGGLELWISKYIVEKHSGKLVCSSGGLN
jgi:signal transduction histidine kinase